MGEFRRPSSAICWTDWQREQCESIRRTDALGQRQFTDGLRGRAWLWRSCRGLFCSLHDLSVAPARVLEPEPLAKFGDLGIPNPPLGQTQIVFGSKKPKAGLRVLITTACQRSPRYTFTAPVKSRGRFSLAQRPKCMAEKTMPTMMMAMTIATAEDHPLTKPVATTAAKPWLDHCQVAK